MSAFQKVAAVSEIPPGGRISAIVDDRAILVVRVQDQFFAIEDVCSHDGQPLTDGPLIGCEITCPRHGARFDVTTGKPMCMPATSPIPRFEVKVENDEIFVGDEL
ncbi:MAG: carAc [Planctomycetaceae bacterium]|nr:carAc [Planctomycetaceae bacterium]